MVLRRIWLMMVLVAAMVAPAWAVDAAWTTQMTPFRIAGNLYYVGSEDLAAYLIATPEGEILINSNLASSPKQIRASVEKLGFRWKDVKILLVSHAHFDHCAGSAEIMKETGARYEVLAEDVATVESGGRKDFAYGKDKTMRFAPVHVDRALHDGDTVTLGGSTLTAHKTAGHTRGTTTWTMDVKDGGRTLHAVIVGSPNVNPGYKLVGNAAYPQIAADYAHGFEVLKKLPCDLFLGAHGGYFELAEKYARLEKGDKDAFIDPAGYKAYVAEREQAFREELARQGK